ncbi:hypothetical protein [Qipengyuania mesophila]|uniref:hypothetical protein n=1 Tax=Qipengyuania mesophila TaxID=2867246 RepID=UPI003513EE84
MTDMSSHPIILHADLYAEDERAPQTQFVPERQVAFLEALAVTGSVRAAARRVKVSHQTCYRARRSSAAFGRAWDAALVVARGAAEAKLADLAMNGVVEEVWYHGDLIGQRRRFSDRLLLAHLARLDRMRGDERIEALAEDFDAMVLRLRRGEPIEVEVTQDTAQGERDSLSPGQCNTRSMSPAEEAPEPPAEPPCRCAGARFGTDRGRPHFRRGPDGPEPVVNVAGEGPCCDAPRWPQCRHCPHYPPVSRVIEEMAEQRPADAPLLHHLGDANAVEALQMEAFCAGVEEWWRVASEEELAGRIAELEDDAP